ncbi:hypothetical protein Skr01_65210 [Sphaerisporangium krabiense]|uniref:DUF397 domain-containing protein n=1 Tax=Sphaerisporangium krabiense TaxID=763782 RepID=A0A7W9DN00_9ACTN|nr:DUF397 domain-containing protein [Sphaerisporangium krabiense]MBB5624862.1 hypothetical protein [Sphaerisporangium krabiense]GII66436.1 hypothetical protein Skr01_65210 [Sphaerisporangium krabiense]
MSDVQEKAELYAMDISDVTWLSAPGSTSEDRIEIAYLRGGAVAMRNPSDPAGTVLRYTAAEWNAFVLGVRDGEFDD